MRGRNNSRGSGNPRNSAVSRVNMLKSSLHGHENKLTAVSPPSFNRKPYNTIVVEELVSMVDPNPTTREMISLLSVATPQPTDSGNITVKSIITALIDQLDISPTNTNVVIKIQRIDLWSIGTNALLPTIRGTFFGLNSQIAGQSAVEQRLNPIKVIEDVGVPGADAAVVSYSFPRDQADMPLTFSSHQDQLVASWKSDIAELKVVARYHLHWNTGKDVIISQPP